MSHNCDECLRPLERKCVRRYCLVHECEHLCHMRQDILTMAANHPNKCMVQCYIQCNRLVGYLRNLRIYQSSVLIDQYESYLGCDTSKFEVTW